MSGSAENRVLSKERFLQELQAIEMKESHYTMLTKEKYAELLQEVKDATAAVKKTALQYRRVKRFQIVEIGGVEKIATNTASANVLYYLPIDEIYDVLEAAHAATGHGGRDRLRRETSKTYANITVSMINVFLSVCEACVSRRTKKRGFVSQSIPHTELNSHSQVDLIDMHSQADREYKYIMAYQDHRTKFVLLRALQTKCAAEVASQLHDIFLTFGAPCILRSNKGREFASTVITRLKLLWPELNIVHGEPRQSQAYQDVENMVAAWMKDNATTRWAEGLSCVQFSKNRAWHPGISQSPFKAMFGIEPRVGLSTSSLPAEVVSALEKEEDLEEVMVDQQKK